MAKRVVVHHAHHPSEKLYKLVHAQADEVTKYVHVENPKYDPEKLKLAQYHIRGVARGNGNRPMNDFDPEIAEPTKIEEQTETVYSDHQEIVWADWDEQWEGLSDDEIAAKQRQIVKDVFAAQAAEAEQAAAAAADVRHIGEVEVEL